MIHTTVYNRAFIGSSYVIVAESIIAGAISGKGLISNKPAGFLKLASAHYFSSLYLLMTLQRRNITDADLFREVTRVSWNAGGAIGAGQNDAAWILIRKQANND